MSARGQESSDVICWSLQSERYIDCVLGFIELYRSIIIRPTVTFKRPWWPTYIWKCWVSRDYLSNELRQNSWAGFGSRNCLMLPAYAIYVRSSLLNLNLQNYPKLRTKASSTLATIHADFGWNIHTFHRVHPNRSPKNFLVKMERGRIQGLPNFLPSYLRNG